MSPKDYRRREEAAKKRLQKIGEYENALDFLVTSPPPYNWEGTPLEYAEEEMPTGLLGDVIKFFGLW